MLSIKHIYQYFGLTEIAAVKYWWLAGSLCWRQAWPDQGLNLVHVLAKESNQNDNSVLVLTATSVYITHSITCAELSPNNFLLAWSTLVLGYHISWVSKDHVIIMWSTTKKCLTWVTTLYLSLLPSKHLIMWANSKQQRDEDEQTFQSSDGSFTNTSIVFSSRSGE